MVAISPNLHKAADGSQEWKHSVGQAASEEGEIELTFQVKYLMLEL